MDRLDDGGSKGDVIDKIPVHHIQMQPIRASIDGTGGFLTNFREIGSKQGRSDDAIEVSLGNHGIREAWDSGMGRKNRSGKSWKERLIDVYDFRDRFFTFVLLAWQLIPKDLEDVL
jgi:hypothetical protein